MHYKNLIINHYVFTPNCCLISKLEREQIVQKEGIGRHTLYSLHKNINHQENIFIQFVNRLSK
jgi:hypothetical protein